MFNRRNNSKCNDREKKIPKKNKNMKYKALSPFITGNERLLNEENYDNTKTTYASLSEKYYMSHTIPDDFTEKNKRQKKQMMMTNTRRKL